MANFVVDSGAGLLSALKGAKSGDVIKLSSGTYDSVSLQNIKIDGSVTITSADDAHKAIISNLTVKGSSGLTFSNLDLTAKANATDFNFQVSDSKGIVLDKMTITGAGFEHQPFIIRNSTDVTVTNSEFTNAYNALSLATNTNVNISDNLFHNIRCDGVHGNVTTGLVVARNMFTDFHPVGEIGTTGDHADAIQLWTENTTTSATNVTIDSNVFVRGTGSQVQGVWITDASGDKPWTNIAVTNNYIAGGMYNGIGVGGAQNATVTGNEIVGYGDQMSFMRLYDVAGGTVSGNKSYAYDFKEVSDVVQQGNISTARVGQLGAFQERLELIPSLLDSATKALGKPAKADSSDLYHAAAAVQPVVEAVRVGGTTGDDSLKHGTTGLLELSGGKGNDSYFANTDNTKVIEFANEGQDRVYAKISYVLPDNVEDLFLMTANTVGTGNSADNRIAGTTGDESLYGMGGNDVLLGGAGNDMAWGGDGNDDVRGEAGNDFLLGGNGNDTLRGGDGNDMMMGEAGNDVIEGGAGVDSSFGGRGADTFQFRNGDLSIADTKTIGDFSRKDGDHVNLTMVDANTKTTADDAFKFIGTGNFTHTAGELRYQVVNGSAHLSGDVNGDGTADFMITLTGVSALGAQDIYL